MVRTPIVLACLALGALAAPLPASGAGNMAARSQLPDASRVRVPVAGRAAELRSELETILMEVRDALPSSKSSSKVARKFADEPADAIQRMAVERCGIDGC